MVELICRSPDIYKIDVPLTGNPLKNLNCYVIKDGGESAVIDTGFRTEECWQALKGGAVTRVWKSFFNLSNT